MGIAQRLYMVLSKLSAWRTSNREYRFCSHKARHTRDPATSRAAAVTHSRTGPFERRRLYSVTCARRRTHWLRRPNHEFDRFEAVKLVAHDFERLSLSACKRSNLRTILRSNSAIPLQVSLTRMLVSAF